MALVSFSGSSFYYKSFDLNSQKLNICKPLYSSQSTPTAIKTAQPLVRRSANYKLSLWSFDHIQSLSSKYKGNDYTSRADTLIDAVKKMIRKVGHPLSTLELIDDLQRLGIAYHFMDEINYLLKTIYHNYYETQDRWDILDINLKALGFRLLRQLGYHVPQDIFRNFNDMAKNFKPHLYEDTLCMLNLYEASYHTFENESVLEDVRDFTARYLKENLESINENLSSLVTHALELPLHWRVPRVEAKWFIQVYEKRSDMNTTLIELAKLDFNIVQAIHLEDLKDSSRWDINLVGELPNYMKICFLGFYNSINEITYNTLTKTGFLILPYLKKAWTDLCKAYLVEPRWYHSGHTPRLEEYLDNACVTIASPVTLTHLKVLTSVSSNEEILKGMESAESIVRYASLIVRLVDDLGTSSDEIARGDTPKSIQCYMLESGATEKEARRYIEKLILKTWKKLNKERAGANSQFLREFNDAATNIARMAHFMYGDGDKHGRPELTRPHVLSLLMNPIQGIQ